MADQLNYTGAVDIYDPELFADTTDLAGINLYSNTGGRKKITGQVVANKSLEIGDLSALTELDGSAGNVLDPNDLISIRDVSTNQNKVIKASNLSGSSLSTYALVSNKLFVTGSAGITGALAGGVLTITIPAGGILTGGSFEFVAADATYSNGVLISNGIKIRINNTANGTVVLKQFAPMVYVRTNATTIDLNNPTRLDQTLTFNSLSDEMAAGITSFVVKDIPSNAGAGGTIVF